MSEAPVIPELKDCALNKRFGPLGSGGQVLLLGGTTYRLPSLLEQLGIVFDDVKAIDVQAVEDHYVLRYFDPQDARIVAYEFDSNFRKLAETRVAEWTGAGTCFSFFGGH